MSFRGGSQYLIDDEEELGGGPVEQKMKGQEEKKEAKGAESKAPEKKTETGHQSADELLTELNIYDNLRKSAENLEQQIRAQLKSFLDPAIYTQFIVDAPKELTGRYSVITEDKKDLLYYYQHALNFLLDFQKLMVPVSQLHNELTKLISKQRLLDKAKQLYWDSAKLNITLNELGARYNDFLLSIQGLELDTGLGHMPTFFQDFKRLLFSSGTVQACGQQVAKNPIVVSYKAHGDGWRELLGLPPASSEHSLSQRGWEEDEDLTETPEEEIKAAPEEAKSNAEVKEQSQEGVLQKLQKMEVMKAALNRILTDLSGAEISESVRKDYEKTIELTSQILKKIDRFSQKKQSWKNFIAFAYDLSPIIKELLSSLPQAYSALNKILREHFLTMARQLNWIIRECFLYLDQLESDFYLKDGLIQHLGEGGRDCGLFIIDNDPCLSTTQELLDKILGENMDAYLYFHHDLYYINRYQKKRNGDWAIHVKKLRYSPVIIEQDPLLPAAQEELKKILGEKSDANLYFHPHLYHIKRYQKKQGEDCAIRVEKMGNAEEEQKGEEVADSSPLFKALRTYLNFPTQAPPLLEGYSCIYPNLQPHHLSLIQNVLTNPETGKLTGRYRDPSLYQGFRLSLANMAKEFQSWVAWWGYEFVGTERYPYTQATLEQRQELLDDENERLAHVAKHHKTKDYKQQFLGKRFLSKTEELLEEERHASRKKQEEKEQLAHYKHWLVKTKTDERIRELESEIPLLRSRISLVKQKKIALLRRLWSAFEKRPGQNCQAAILSLGLTPEELHLLEEGRTGKLIATLRLLTFTPADRNGLIQLQLQRRRQDQSQAAHYHFFASRRQKQFRQRVAALEELERILKPSDRIQEVLDYLSAKKPEHFAALQYETALLADLQGIDQFSPNTVFGLKPLDLAESIFKEFEETRQAKKQARQEKRQESKKTRETTPGPHFFTRTDFAKPVQSGVEQKLPDPTPSMPVVTQGSVPQALPAPTITQTHRSEITPYRF